MQCKLQECLADEGWSQELGECIPNACNEDRADGKWWQGPGDCDHWHTSRIEDAVVYALERYTPVINMLMVLFNSSETKREELWDFGSESPAIEIRRASPKHWFGPYTTYRFELITMAIFQAFARLTGGFTRIRCKNYTTRKCKGDLVAWFWPGTVYLCPEYFDLDPTHRGTIMMHEVLHKACIFWIRNTPRDVKIADCPNEFAENKCYGHTNSEFLGQNAEEIMVDVWDYLEGTRTVPAASINIDNYVWWMRRRYEAYGRCILPHGAEA